MAKKKKKDEEEGPVGVLSRQGDEMNLTSENDLAKSEDYDPQQDVRPNHAPDDPDEVEGVLAGQPSVSEPQGIDDILRFEGGEK